MRKLLKKPDFTGTELKEILRKNEKQANYLLSDILGIIFILAVWLFVMFKMESYLHSTRLMESMLILIAAVTLASVGLCHVKRGVGNILLYILVGDILLVVFGANALMGFKLWLAYAIPIIIVCRYCAPRLTVFTSIMAEFCVTVSAFMNAFLPFEFGILDLNTVSYPEGAVLPVTGSLQVAVIHTPPERLVILKNTIFLTAIPNMLMVALIAVVSIVMLRWIMELILSVQKTAASNAEILLELQKSRERVLMSQLSPHFLYNALTAIGAIEGNPDETVDAIGEFGKYLRENIVSIEGDIMVPLEKEMEHVKRYISLEKLRFQEKIRVEYDIQSGSFDLPTLSIQLLAENAIKHGISRRPEGGHLVIRTRETETDYIIRVEDDGVGFSPEAEEKDGSHIGLKNLRTRLKMYCEGSLLIRSIPGEGAQAEIRIPKEKTEGREV